MSTSAMFDFSINGKLAVRKDDKAIFQPSYPDGCDECQAFSDFFCGKISWYFRRIVPVPRRWWHFRRRWKRTGEIWALDNPALFDVVSADEAWRIAHVQ